MIKIKVKCGAIIREVVPSALKWYKEAGWNVIEKSPKEVKYDKTNSKKTATT